MTKGTEGEDHEGRVIDFGRNAVDYETHRPGFPEAFFDRLLHLGWISAGQRAAPRLRHEWGQGLRIGGRADKSPCRLSPQGVISGESGMA